MATGIGVNQFVTRDWRADALCKEYSLALFFAPDPEPAKAVCARCLVRDECLAYALAGGIRDGVFGGLTGVERRRRHQRTLREAAKVRRLLEEQREAAWEAGWPG